MIKKLYEAGCFDYKKFILDNIKTLSLSSDETLVFIKILDDYPNNKTISREGILGCLPLTKNKIDKALASLLERSFYEIYIDYNNGVGQEYISLDVFFNKVQAILNNTFVNVKDELYNANQYLVKEFNRILTAKELEILSSMITDDRYSLDDIKNAREVLKNKGKLLNMKNLAQALVLKNEEPAKLRPTPKVVKDFFQNIK